MIKKIKNWWNHSRGLYGMDGNDHVWWLSNGETLTLLFASSMGTVCLYLIIKFAG